MDFGKAPEPGTIALIVFTALVGVLMGVFGKAAAEWLLNLILRPVRFVKESLYSWVAPRNPLSISLRSYKRHVARSNLTRIENPVGPNLKVPLEDAFAPLKLISGSTEESVDLFTLAAASRRCIVLGGPGTGKTTLMKSLLTSVIKGRVREEEVKNLIPVFVELRGLAKKEHTVEQAVVEAFAEHHFPGAERFVASALEQGRMLVILDGLDEAGASRDFVAEQIRKFCEYDDQRPPARQNRLFVTCREHSYRTQDLRGVIPEVVRVEPFANHHMRVFLQGWPAHNGRTAMQLYGLIQSDPQIRDICRNPLLLTILTGLYLDTDNFELPSSRESFYKDAVDELLVHRPARRNVKQAFEADDKRQILERAALDRLETVKRHEDPEEFTREVIREKAEEVLRREGFDPRELITELAEVNGILKPGSEGSYTCAHRTIQEYFAAREASRRRKPEEVVDHFGGRPEFIEVLYFYCGLVDNLPSLAYVVNTLVSQQRWLEAGRCLLYMKEPPGAALVERVARELHDRVSPPAESKGNLEVLSSLAQRRAPKFDAAREHFARAIDRLAEGHGAGGASALESVLATSPEAAMKVIPGLLKHSAPRRKEAAVRLLRDIGTDEALDQLVLLLKDADPAVRAEAGRRLAGMLKTRRGDLEARAAFLPQRKDPAVWPLEDLFPGRLAIPIAESLSEQHYVKENRAISYAVQALRARAAGGPKPILKQWPRVVRDRALRRYRRLAGQGLVAAGYALSLACVLALAALQVWGQVTDSVVTLTFAPLRVHVATPGAALRGVRRQAQLIVADVEENYPPNASGWSRLLPWNWSVEPLLPEQDEETLEAVRRWTEEDLDPHTLSDSALRLLFLHRLVPEAKIEEMDARLDLLKQRLPDVEGRRYLTINPVVDLSSFVIILASLILVALLLWRVTAGRSYDGSYDSLRGGPRSLATWRVTYLGLFLFTTVSLIADWNGSPLMRLLPLLVFVSVVSLGLILKWLEWPFNDYLDALDAIAPPEKGKAAASYDDDEDGKDDEDDDDQNYF